MIVFEHKKDVTETVLRWKKEGYTVGLVPTMGYLHEGHLSLMKRAKEECDKVVVSVFVNPIQFGPTEDLEAYPRDFARDRALCESEGVDLIFHPTPEEMYSPDFSSFVEVESLTKELCGKSRPTHFRGVCTVVSKLFHITHPDKAFFGQKDAQQLSVVRRMTEDLDMGIEIIGCPIIREADGLAKSSRNTYLSDKERTTALVLSRAVRLGEEMAKGGEKDADRIVAAMTVEIKKEPLATIDYVEAVDFKTVAPVHTVEGETLFAMAVRIGKVRLIDNFIFEGDKLAE